MVDKIIRLKDKDGNIVYPLSRGVAADSIGTAALQDDSVTTSKIADSSITSDKIDSATIKTADITFASGYSCSDTDFCLKKGGIVYLMSNIVCPQITTNNNTTAAFTLPAGWRPYSNRSFVVYSTSGSTVVLARVRITTTGEVYISKYVDNIPASLYTQISSISFPAYN